MKKFKQIWMWMAIAAASFSFTSCDDDYYWHDDYYWYDDYNHGGWGWNQGDWNNGSNGSQDDDLLLEAQTLTGDWRGSVMLSELAEDGQTLICILLEHKGYFIESDRLKEEIWPDGSVSKDALTATAKRLKEDLSPIPGLVIESARGHGYVLKCGG